MTVDVQWRKMNKRIVFGYWSSWSICRQGNGKFNPSNIDPFLCTHLAYAFFGIENGVIKSLDNYLDMDLRMIAKFIALKQLNKHLKLLASIGGWNVGSEKFSIMSASPETRATFIQSVVAFLQKHSFDGLDFNWQYPAQRGGKDEDYENYITLLKELQAALKQYDLLLTVAVPGTPSLAAYSYKICEMARYVDLVNVMTFDYHTPYSDIFGHNAPLYGGDISIRTSINFWLESGIPPSKLTLGIPFFGHTYIMPPESSIVAGSPSSGRGELRQYTKEAGYIGYNEICESFDKWTHVWDASARVPYAYNAFEWISYDDAHSIDEKIKFVKQLNLAGVMVWCIDLDDFHGVSGQRNPLLHQINKALLE